METPLNRLPTTGSVVAVASSPVHGFSKPTVDRIMLIEGQGVKGDAHAGKYVRHRYLAKRKPSLANLRQVHLMPSELFCELRAAGYDVRPGELGENVTTVGLQLNGAAARHNYPPWTGRHRRTNRVADPVHAHRSLPERLEKADGGNRRRTEIQERSSGRGQDRRTGYRRRRREGRTSPGTLDHSAVIVDIQTMRRRACDTQIFLHNSTPAERDPTLARGATLPAAPISAGAAPWCIAAVSCRAASGGRSCRAESGRR
jgi:hypothetical protein